MTNTYKTDQEKFWAGEFGTDYISRNQGSSLLASNLNFFSKALSAVQNPKSCIEFGANVGMNLKALRLLFPKIDLAAIEINKDAIERLLNAVPDCQTFHQSILDFRVQEVWDLVLIKGVLIHINPDELNTVYEKLTKACRKSLLIAEYYNPAPVSIPYRGNSDRLYKRDFAGEILDRYPEFTLIDYGFAYHRDPNFPQDDINWFLLEKA